MRNGYWRPWTSYAGALADLADDPKHLDGEIGMTGVWQRCCAPIAALSACLPNWLRSARAAPNPWSFCAAYEPEDRHSPHDDSIRSTASRIRPDRPVHFQSVRHRSRESRVRIRRRAAIHALLQLFLPTRGKAKQSKSPASRLRDHIPSPANAQKHVDQSSTPEKLSPRGPEHAAQEMIPSLLTRESFNQCQHHGGPVAPRDANQF
jgi:hypothetical protein